MDRGFGKPTQPLDDDGDTAPQVVVFKWGRAGDAVDDKPVSTLTEVTALEAVPANANVDGDPDEVPQYVVWFADS